MKKTLKTLFFSAAATACALCAAQEVGRVVSTVPVIQQVGVPRQVCNTEQVVTPGQKSGGGALMGAIAGGAMGNAIGGGSGKAAATILGIIGGAAVGDSIEGSPSSEVRNVQRCTTQTFFENRTIGYNVTYEFAGKQYNVRMPQDPGQFVQLQVTPVGTSAPAVPVYAPPAYTAPAYGSPQSFNEFDGPVISNARPGYVNYYSSSAYYPAQVALAVGFGAAVGYRVGGFGGHHRHWR